MLPGRRLLGCSADRDLLVVALNNRLDPGHSVRVQLMAPHTSLEGSARLGLVAVRAAQVRAMDAGAQV